MPDFRAYAPGVPAKAIEIRLSPEESHHLTTVNRCRPGDPVTAFDGQGREWLTECVAATRSATILRVKEARPAARRPGALTLAQALPKGSTMDDIVRQATEVGAARIVPLLTERTQVQLDGDRADKKIGKWRTTAIEAAKQCGNPWLPEIAPLARIGDFLAEPAETRAATGVPLRLIASLAPGTTSLKQALALHLARHGTPPTAATWLIGPEGDFSPAEIAAALGAGYFPVTLGPLVLRSDTAALYALSILSNELAT